ncbi:uncharacterized protein [Ptychodera flava]|uniref:uncharacterized protein n=1 Tax=Ptychodera flava TaxID=63121 RepID=UPI00396A2504
MALPKSLCRLVKYTVFFVFGASLLPLVLHRVGQSVEPENAREYHIDPDSWSPSSSAANMHSHLSEDYTYKFGVSRLFSRLWMSQQRMLYSMPQFIIGGPTSRHQNFKIALLYALYHKRAVVATPFANFYYKESGDEQFWWSFNETFDVEKLAEIIPLVSTQYFSYQCWGRAMLLAEPHVTRHDGYERDFNQSRLHMLQKVHIEVPKLPALSKNFRMVEWRFRAADSDPCLCMYKPSEMAHLVGAEIPESLQKKLTTLINQHLTRAPYIRKEADEIIEYVRNYGPYIAIEWKDTGLDMKDVTAAIAKYMKKHKVEVAYIVHPSFLTEDVERALREVIPHMFSYHNAIAIAFLQGSRFAREKYLWSLLEQEIAFQADIFLASDDSNWSTFVIDERTAFDKTTYSLQRL